MERVRQTERTLRPAETVERPNEIHARIECRVVNSGVAATRSKKTYLGALYQRLVVRRGRQRAIIAVAHSLLRSIYFMLNRHEEYHDLGFSYFDERKRESVANALTRRLDRLGYHVTLEPKPNAIPPIV